MKTARWVASVPTAILLSAAVWMVIEMRFHTIRSAYYGDGFIQNVFGLAPLFVRAALSTTTFVFVGVLVAPGHGRLVAFLFFALSLAFSVGGFGAFEANTEEALPFWLASTAGFVLGSLLGLLMGLSLQNLREIASGRAPIDELSDQFFRFLIGGRPVTHGAARRGVRFMRLYLDEAHFVDPDRLREPVLMALVMEACRRAAEEEEDRVPRFRFYYLYLKEVATEAAAASRGEISESTRVRSLLEFHGII